MRTEESRVDQARIKILGISRLRRSAFSEKRSRRLRSPAPDQECAPKAPFIGRPRRGAEGTTLSRGASRRTRDARFASFAKHPRDSEARARSDANAPSHRLLERGARFAREGPFLATTRH